MSERRRRSACAHANEVVARPLGYHVHEPLTTAHIEMLSAGVVEQVVSVADDVESVDLRA